MPRPRLVLPIAGRAPMMFSVDGCRPDSISSRSLKPGGGAGDDVAALEGLLQLVHRQRQQVAERAGGVGDAVLGDLEDLGLGLVERLGDVVGLEVARSRRSRWRRRSAGAARPCPARSWRSARRWRSPAWRSAARAASAAPPISSSRPLRRSSSATVTASTGWPVGIRPRIAA